MSWFLLQAVVHVPCIQCTCVRLPDAKHLIKTPIHRVSKRDRFDLAAPSRPPRPARSVRPVKNIYYQKFVPPRRASSGSQVQRLRSPEQIHDHALTGRLNRKWSSSHAVFFSQPGAITATFMMQELPSLQRNIVHFARKRAGRLLYRTPTEHGHPAMYTASPNVHVVVPVTVTVALHAAATIGHFHEHVSGYGKFPWKRTRKRGFGRRVNTLLMFPAGFEPTPV